MKTTGRPVHPRVCGEHLFQRGTLGFVFGSSPRVRGTLKSELNVGALGRFIPACAGNTRLLSSTTQSPAVHPRVCGEHSRALMVHAPLAGSSPRVRGTPPLVRPWCWGRRFIPACAGNTRATCRWRCSGAVHPRVCGEHLVNQTLWGPAAGSSPRVRGTRPKWLVSARASRFIPACAGNTVVRASRRT